MRGRTWTIVAVVLALAVTGCGGDDAESDGGADGEGVEDAEDAEDASNESQGESGAEGEDGLAEVRYEVEPGDTLSIIADDFGVTVEDLVDANDLEDPDMLMEGQELVIPEP